jgi:hypothetical protein
MIKSGEYGGQNMDASMACHLFLEMPSRVALGIIEIQILFAMSYVTPLLSVRAGQENHHVVENVYRCERRAL